MTSEIKGCLGCGIHTDTLAPFCPHCAELIEYERYDQPEKKPEASKNQQHSKRLPGLLAGLISSGPVLLVTLAGAFIVAATLCQPTQLDCGLFGLCLLS